MMAQLLVRNLDDDVKARLRIPAARHGRSMEEEVRAILRQAVTPPSPPRGGLGTEIAALFKKNGLHDGEEITESK
jgi:plasmid stability protein